MMRPLLGTLNIRELGTRLAGRWAVVVVVLPVETVSLQRPLGKRCRG